MPWFSRNDTAWLSRSENSATSTLAPVTSLRPDDCTWTAARCTTRWKPAVGSGSLGVWVTMPFRRLSMKDLEVMPQAIDIDAAGLEHRGRILVLRHRQQQVLERGVFVPALARQGEGSVEGLLEVLGQHGHRTTST